MLMIPVAARNIPDPVIRCFFRRVALSDAATESCFSIRGLANEFAASRGPGLRH